MEHKPVPVRTEHSPAPKELTSLLPNASGGTLKHNDSAGPSLDQDTNKPGSKSTTTKINAHKHNKKSTGKHNEKSTGKQKNAKKAATIAVDDSTSSTSESDASDSDSSHSEAAKKKKKRAKKKRDAAKLQKHARKRKPKKTGKSSKTLTASETSSDSDADSDSDSSSDSSSANSDIFGRSSDSDSFVRTGKSHRPPSQAHLTLRQDQQLYNPSPQFQPYGYNVPAFGVPGVPMVNPIGFNGGHPALGGMSTYQPPPPAQPSTAGRRAMPQHILPRGRGLPRGIVPNPDLDSTQLGHQNRDGKKSKNKSKSVSFRRVDEIWDYTIRDFRLQDTTEGSANTGYEGYAFHVRRTFDFEGKHKFTFVDIRSKILRDTLQVVMGDVEGVTLVEGVPKLDPNILFLYLEDMREHLNKLKTVESDGDKKARKNEAKRNAKKRQQLKLLVKYLDKDYEDVKKSLYPLLANGLITFDLLWALWKPDTLAFTSTYGSPDLPCVFKVGMAEMHYCMNERSYHVRGKYFEYDGKHFGYGGWLGSVDEFHGSRKITSMGLYPLKYHKNEEKIRQELIDRGKKFVALSGVQYRSYDGMAYYKKKKNVVKANITGRIMIDANIFRRINPNYPTSEVGPKGCKSPFDDETSDNELDGAAPCEQSDSDSNTSVGSMPIAQDQIDSILMLINQQSMTGEKPEQVNNKLVQIPKDDSKNNGTGDEETDTDNKSGDGKGDDDDDEGKDGRHKDRKIPEFSDEEYLMASPVVQGFAFAEKMWLEFDVSSVKDIQWSDNAYESLVLEPKTKDILKALVESHKYHAAESIDDVIQGKGKGLVAVLHGPPGTGKTLTAEGISELLKSPLYTVSAGELGPDPAHLEAKLQKIMDICHTWGAILLLDEADVFLEKRDMHNLHRNALVSIFLRQLEYFQGILFLTTNRVETFDDAFQSRIHIALRYGSLDNRAKKAVFKLFIARVFEKTDLVPFTEEDYTALARHELNGRQIKNTVRTAQALAVNKGEALSMKHIMQVLDVQMSFDRDLKGGPGFQDAMRSYF